MTGRRAPSGVQVVALADLDSRTEQAWDELADATGAPLFARPGWARRWAAVFAPDHAAVIVLREGGALAAAAAVVATRFQLRSATNPETVLWAPVLARPGLLPSLAGAALGAHPGRLSFEFVPGDHLGEPRDPQTRVALTASLLRESPVVEVSGGWDAFWKARSGKSRQLVRRMAAKAAERGEVGFTTRDGGENLERELREGLAVETRSWKARTRTAVLSRPRVARYYEEVSRWAAGRDALRLHHLRIGGRPAAFAYVLEDAGTAYVVKIAYDEEWAAVGPGILLLHHVIERAFASGRIRQVHLGGENQRFKRTWSTGVDSQYRLEAYSHAGFRAATAAARAPREAVRKVAARTLTVEQRQRWGSLLDRGA